MNVTQSARPWCRRAEYLLKSPSRAGLGFVCVCGGGSCRAEGLALGAGWRHQDLLVPGHRSVQSHRTWSWSLDRLHLMASSVLRGSEMARGSSGHLSTSERKSRRPELDCRAQWQGLRCPLLVLLRSRAGGACQLSPRLTGGNPLLLEEAAAWGPVPARASSVLSSPSRFCYRLHTLAPVPTGRASLSRAGASLWLGNPVPLRK